MLENIYWIIFIFIYIKIVFIFYYTLMRQEFMDFVAQNNVIWVAIWLLIATKVWELTKSLIEDFVTPLIFSPILKKLKIEKLEDLSWRGVLYWKFSKSCRIMRWSLLLYIVKMLFFLRIRSKNRFSKIFWLFWILNK